MPVLFVKLSRCWPPTVWLLIYLLLNCAPRPPAPLGEAQTIDTSFIHNADPRPPALIEGVDPAAIGPLNSADPNMCYNLGVYYYSRGELNTAMKKLKENIKQQPRHGESHAMLGLIYEKKGEPKKAEREFAVAAQTLPTLSKFYCQIAAFYKQKGMQHLLRNNLDQAMICLQKSMTFIPQDEDTKQLLAFSYCLMADQCTAGNQGTPATDYYQQARRLYPALPGQRMPAEVSVWPAWVQDNFPIGK